MKITMKAYRTISVLLFFLMLALGTTKRPPKHDIIFIIDINQNGFQLAKKIALTVLDHQSISPETTRVAFVTISEKAILKFHFKSFVNRECVKNAINRVKPSLESTQDDALLGGIKIAQQLFKNYTRANATKIIFRILNEDVSISKKQSNIYDDHQVKSYDVVIIGKTNKISTLISSPENQHLFLIQKENQISEKLKDVLKVSYVECTGNKEVRDECDRVCQCVNGKKTNCYRLRREVSRLNAAERKRFYQAIYHFSMLEGYRQLHSKFVWVHENYMCTKIHNEDYFNPWHRWYIIVFENSLREMDCRITVPYWDWSYWKERGDLFSKDVWRTGKYELGCNGDINRSFCVQSGLFREEEWNGFKRQDNKEIMEKINDTITKKDKKHYHPDKTLDKSHCMRRYFSWDQADVKPAKSIDKMLGVKLHQFRDIMLYLRYRIHGSVHMSVGGTMASTFSADVPEFWLHHTFLDKIWYLWQERGSKYKWYYYGKLKKNMFLWPYTQKQLVDTMNMPKCVKYRYDVWPEHNITEFNDLDSSKFKGNYLERSVCNGHEDFETYQDYLESVFPDVPEYHRHHQHHHRGNQHHSTSRRKSHYKQTNHKLKQKYHYSDHETSQSPTGFH